MATKPAPECEGGVWLAETEAGEVIALDLDRGRWVRRPGQASAWEGDGEWQPLYDIAPIDIGEPVCVWTAPDTGRETAPVTRLERLDA